jgi:hypothetical protein
VEQQTANLSLALEACDATALADLMAARGGAALDVDAAHELLGSLIELRDAEEGSTDPGQQGGLLFRTVEVGGATLHSPTIAARIALQEFDRMGVPPEWAEFVAEYIALGAGWILAHGRDPDTLARFAPDTAQSLIESWAARLTCTSHELSLVVHDLTSWGYPPVSSEAASRKKDLAGPTWPPSWLVWPRVFAAARVIIGCTKFRKRMFTGFAGRVLSVLANWKR